MENLKELQLRYEKLKGLGLKLNIERGQPGDDNFDLSNKLLGIVTEKDVKTQSGFDVRNYPGGVLGLPEARELFSTILDARPEEMIIGNNSSLQILSHVLMWALLRGLADSPAPWCRQQPKMIVTVPGYDRHFTLLAELGFEMISVKMTKDGPDINEVEKAAAADASVKGIIFVPTYSNPSGETVSAETVKRLATMKTAAPDFTIFADDAYVVHHLTDNPVKTENLLRACEEAGNPNRVYLFGSTSKITFSGAGIGFMATSTKNVSYIAKLFGTMFIGPNKVEQLRHVKFFGAYPGGVAGLMKKHAKLLKPKFDIVHKVLSKELEDTGLATWSKPQGGYFISLDTIKPIAKRAVELCEEAGVAVTPTGATFPLGRDPKDSNIRISPTRPPVDELEKAIEVLAVCVKLASAEYDNSVK
ncbi:MAG TPA: aminotransferase class I/II-fold pyridoxal phosphate-dependent enzyme [Deltaproteobacteria bacterium]|nr:aminotransferase class I/II-fold pyridoxal phosphate-dependent enzyme [Deltaproteobacteria bacterium]